MKKLIDLINGKKMAIGFVIRCVILSLVKFGVITMAEAEVPTIIADFIMGGGGLHKVIKGEIFTTTKS